MNQKKKIVVLTGAGISAESGLKTFRDSNGLWENHRVEDVATPEAFARDPDLVYRFYNLRRAQLAEVKPNPAHDALVTLENHFQDDFLLVTQNVDDLHERAGSKRVLHMHGELKSAKCSKTHKAVRWEEDLTAMNLCDCCAVQNEMRPDIVWFGEMPYFMDEIYQALFQADVFIAIGTSGNVYPAAGFVAEANSSNTHTVEINLEPSSVQSQFDEQHYGKAGQVLPDYVASLIGE